MHSFKSRRVYLSLSDDAFDAILEKSTPHVCIYSLIVIQYLGPLAAVLIASPWIMQFPDYVRVVLAVLVTAFLYLGPRWLGKWLEPVRIAKRKSAMLRHIASQHRSAG